jgi:thiosulfate/3-mercaptopyruvate sulfurtransferase
MKRLNILPSDDVIVYDDFGVAGACRAYYMFDVFNHKNVYILNGGYDAWKSE